MEHFHVRIQYVLMRNSKVIVDLLYFTTSLFTLYFYIYRLELLKFDMKVIMNVVNDDIYYIISLKDFEIIILPMVSFLKF